MEKQDQILLKAKKKGLVKGLRHLFLYIFDYDIETEEELINCLEKLRKNKLVKKTINIDKSHIQYKPTLKARKRNEGKLKKESLYRLLYFKELWNITYINITDTNIRLYEIGIDLYNNYGINIYETLKEYKDDLENFNVDIETLESLENDLKK